MTAIKICGVVRIDDAAYAASLGVDYLGFNFWPQSKRATDAYRGNAAAKSARVASKTVKIVGVFVDQPLAEILPIAEKLKLDVVQLHGDEPSALGQELAARGYQVWRAFGIEREEDLDPLASWPAAGFVLDSKSEGRGGSGKPFDHALAARAVAAGHRIVLAGGLDSRNVANAILQVAPFAVDVCSSVEISPGDKDPLKVFAFIEAVRRKISYLKR